MLFPTAHDMIGYTPLVHLAVDAPAGTEVYAKLELANPFGMKDRVAKYALAEARRTGALVPGAPVVESSSGTLALGVALVGRSLGHPVHIVTDPRIDATTLAKLHALDVRVHVVSAMTGQGWQSARLERLDTLLRELPGAFCLRQYANPDNPRAYRALAEELLQDLGSADLLVGAVGSGGSLCGTTRALRRTLPELRSVGVDCVGSVLFDQQDEPRRLQSGLGNSLSPHNLDRGVIDEVHWLNDRESFAAATALAKEQQIFAGNTSGSVYRVLTDVAARARPGSRIVGIFPDRGDRYVGTVYDDAYWATHNLARLPLGSVPIPVAYGTPVRQWSRAAVPRPPERPRRLLFVESNTTGTGMAALRAARTLGLTPVLLTGDPGRYRGLDEQDCDVMVCDTNSGTALRTAIQDAFPRQDIVGLTTTSDFYTLTVAELADWLDLPGNAADAVAACRNKAITRRILNTAGICQPRFAVVTDPADVGAAVDAVGLPCVVKPVDDSGSNHVRLCTTEGEATDLVARVLAVSRNVRGQPTARTALIEEYVEAPEYSVETFTTDGATVCVGITAKSVTAGPHFVETGHVFPAPLSHAVASAITEATNAALKAVGWRLGPAHTEVKVTPNEVHILEINPRLAGGMIPELIRQATGTDLLEQQLRAATGLPVGLGARRADHTGIRFLLADRTGVLGSVDGLRAARATPGVTAVAVTARTGTAVRPPENAYGRLGHLIARGASVTAVSEALNTAGGRLRLLIDDEGAAGTDIGTASEGSAE